MTRGIALMECSPGMLSWIALLDCSLSLLDVLLPIQIPPPELALWGFMVNKGCSPLG